VYPPGSPAPEPPSLAIPTLLISGAVLAWRPAFNRMLLPLALANGMPWPLPLLPPAPSPPVAADLP
jgi:hypothetical protein